MATPPENRDPAEPSPWSEWLARRDEQADQPAAPAQPPLYDPDLYRRPGPADQPEQQQPAYQPLAHELPGHPPEAYQPTSYQPEYYNQQQPPYQQAPYQEQPYQQAPYQEQPYQQAPYQEPPYQEPPYQQPYAGQPPYQPFPGQPFPGQQYAPEQHLGPTDPYAPPGGRRRTSLPLVGGIVAVVVALVIGGAFALHQLRSPDSTAIDAGGGSAGPLPGSGSTPSASTSGASPTASTSEPTAEVSEATDVPADEAKQQLSDAGVSVRGDIRLSESWTDANGGNLLVASRSVDKKTGDRATAATIRVWHLTHTDTDPKVARSMTDPSEGTCDLDFDTDLDTGQGFVKDLDGDGIAEATVAWHLSCRGDVGPALAKVSLLSDGRKFILRGDGYPGGRPAGSDANLPPAAVKEVDPDASHWPDGFKDAATEVFLKLYS
jgi:hypothetical protein